MALRSTAPELPTLRAFVAVIARVGLTSFGGGISGWMLRIVVHERNWMTEADFVTGLSLCQVFPGVNAVNLAIWLGYRMHGGRGALAGALAMVVPPGLVMIALATLLAHIGDVGHVRSMLNGVAAAAIGLGATLGVRAARHSLALPRLAALVSVVVAIGLLQLPLLPVLAVLVPLSLGIAWHQTA